MRKKAFILLFLAFLLVTALGSTTPTRALATDILITGVIDGPLTGGVPKAIELYVVNDIADLSIYGVGSANNGGGSDGEEFTFPVVAATAGDFIYVASEATGFTDWFGFAPDYTSGAASINGDDAIELFENGTVIDVFGDINVSGSGEPWDYLDGWAYRVSGTEADGAVFNIGNWTFSGPNALDGETTNDTAATPFPTGSYAPPSGDTAPSVTSTTPADGATDVALDANIDISFSEAVTVSGSWFDIACTVSSSHTAVVSGGPQAFTLDPDADFVNDETCTVTILAAQVADQDGTPDNLSSDYIFNFATVSATVGPELIITEIMYDPNSPEDDWEWIEIYNAGSNTIDLTGYVIDDNNSSAHSGANIAGGSLAAGESAVLFNVDDISAADFQAAWGTVNLIPATGWSVMALNNGGDQISLWSDFASYSGDNVDHNNAIDTVDYGQSGFPDPAGASIFLTDLDVDNNVGANWAESTDGASTPLFIAYTSMAAAGNSGADIGSPGTPPASQPLLLTELVVTPTGGEFIEIYNPGDEAVDLSDVYVTDATFAGGSTYYYNIVTGTNAGGGDFADFFARFPDGASIGAGEYQTIALAGSAAFVAEYGVAPTYELFDDGSADGEQIMREALTGSINGQGGLTNDGEVVILFFWDGASDLVADYDYALWGDKAEAVDKTGVAIDGPDADSDTSTYLNDTAVANQDVIDPGAHASGKSWQRDDLTEGAEIITGGNGSTGHDETSEDLSNTFCIGDPTPNAATVCDPETPVVEAKIHEVQGDQTTIAITGTVKVEAVVVADYQGGDQLSGFFIQEEDADVDANSATSEGIFVYCGGCATDVAVGDLVEVTGFAEDFFGMSQIDVPQGNGIVAIMSSGNPLPTPATIDLPASGSTEAEGTFENIEGMLVTFVDELFVSEYFELARYGQLVLTADARPRQFTDANEPSIPGYAAFLDDLNSKRIILDDDNNIQNDALGSTPAEDEPYFWPRPGLSISNFVRGGDSISNLTGVLHWSFAGQSGTDAWRVRPVEEAFGYEFTSNNEQPAAPDDVGGTLKVASFNVLNYFTTIDSRGADSQAELDRQREKTAAAICAIDADIVGLIEIENNGNVALTDLLNGANGINENCGPYAFIDTGVIGIDEIVVAFIYKPATVTPVGDFAVLDSSVDSRFIDTFNRPALAQTFAENATGESLTVIVNHLKSKGSPCDDVGDPDVMDGQGNCNVTRTQAAEAMVDWLATDPTGSGDPDFLIIGDLNAYRNEDPIDALEEGADDMVGTSDDYSDLLDTLIGADAYTYVFDGQLGYLDHALANNALFDQVTGVTAWHINADEIPVFDYNDGMLDSGEASFERESTSLDIYNDDAYRASDHDPVIVGLALSSGPAVPTCQGVPATIYVEDGRIVGGLHDGKRYFGVLLGTHGDDVIVGTEGNDFINALSGDDLVCAGDGNDFIFGSLFGENELYGEDGDDIIVGGLQADVVFGGNGNDLIKGLSGDDELYGEDGRDIVLGGFGDDQVSGGNDNDLLFGNASNDALNGGAGSDVCHGGSGTDTAEACEREYKIP